MVICLELGADLHMAQVTPLPLTVSCFNKIQIGFTFLVLADPGSPRKRAVKRVCVCEYARKYTIHEKSLSGKLTGRTLSPCRRPSTGRKVSNTWPYLALSSTCKPAIKHLFNTTIQQSANHNDYYTRKQTSLDRRLRSISTNPKSEH